jgi:hypothetical protein
MRYLLILLLICLSCLSLGCKTNPRFQREAALLRAEILDLEDRYFVAKSQRDAAINALYADGKNDQAERILKRSPGERMVQPSARGDIIYESDYPFRDPGYEPAPAFRSSNGEVIYSGDGYGYSHDLLLDEYSLPARSNFSSVLDEEGVIQWEQPSGQGRPGSVGDHRSSSPTQSTQRPNGSADRNSGTSANPSSAKRGSLSIDLQQSFPQLDPVTGADGVQVLVREFSGDRRFFRAEAGTMEVSLIDPAAKGGNQKLGVWKFLPSELDLFFDERAGGILLHLPYQELYPTGELVMVSILYRTSTGRLSETNARIYLQGKNDSSGRQLERGEDDLITRRNSAESFDRNQKVGSADSDRPGWRPIR